MYKILICFGLIYTINGLPQQLPYYNKPIPKDVEVFASLFPGVKVKDPKPLPPRKPTEPTTSNPTYPTKEPTNPKKPPTNPTYPTVKPTFYPKKPPSSTKKPLTTKIPPIYPWTSKKPLNFPTPVYPTLGSNTPFAPNPPPRTTTPPSKYPYQPPRTSTPSNKYPSSKWPAFLPKPSFFPSSQTTPSTPWQPKYPNTVASGSTGTPPWIYPPRPSWPKSHHLVSGSNNYVIEAVNVDGRVLTGSIFEYQPYNEDDGSFKLGFELHNGLSAKVHGFKKNGKLVLEGSYSIFTEDGKPVNIIYKADDENNYQDSEPTIFHLDIPSFDQTNLDGDENDANPVPTYVPYLSNSSKILTVDQSALDDGQFSDLILEPTTQQYDDEV